MITVELKVKHFYLIADILFGIVAADSFETLSKIKTACEGKADEDVVGVQIGRERMIFVYNILTYKPEGQYSRINGEMHDMILTQIQAELAKTEPDPEWVSLAEALETTRQQNLSVVSNLIQQGKSKIFQGNQPIA